MRNFQIGSERITLPREGGDAREGEDVGVRSGQIPVAGRTIARKNGSKGKSPSLISGVDVTTDSVVAKAVVTLASDVRRLDVHWGDGTRDTLTSPPGNLPPDPFPPLGTTTLPQGAYQFFHAYNEPGGGLPFDHNILVSARDAQGDNEFFAVDVTLTPLYNVAFSDVSVGMIGRCDPWPERTSEFDIIQHRPGGEAREFARWKPTNDADTFPLHRLEESALRGRVRARENIHSWFAVIETDDVWDDYYHFRVEIDDAATFESGWAADTTGSGSCRIFYRYFAFAGLYRPLPPSGPVFA